MIKELILSGTECQDHLKKCARALVACDGTVIYKDSVPRYWLVDEESGSMRLLTWNEMQINYPELLDS
ncbi:hypothetical protein [Deinococcus yavapaiensis]|uniref:Uncharacterized protein n=1 Tax=Deinococcus yavapaiensis KR-236 TaxID=694435 RepID=A0A318SA70_9DEIO|nr:hypothetical protein [Deinococcus yavapaiensis]PYE56249.1 hypothetical protein DES52_10153 [Deinococcus yavapaiensis KR-236]